MPHVDPLLVCCGLVTLDVVQTVEALPGPDEKIVADGLLVSFGGPAANAAATAAALGVPTRLVTAIGTGPVAELVRAGLHAAGLEVVDLAARSAASPPVSTVLVTRGTGQRAVVSVNAVGTAELGDAARDALGRGVLDGATALLVDGHHLGAGIVLAAASRAAKVPVVLDGGSWKPGLGDLLTHVDHAVLSADFRLPGDDGTRGGPGVQVDLLAAVMAQWPVSSVARSAGPGTVRVRERGGPERGIPVRPVPDAEVADTLGAGDVLHGALSAALARGAGLDEALQEGTRRASESVRFPGALGWVTGRPVR